MDYQLSEEHQALQEMAYKFAENEFSPLAQECDREEKVPLDLVKKGAETGFTGILIPEEYGGLGGGWLEVALVTEQFSRIDMGLGLVVVGAGFGSENIILFGTEQQKETYLPGIASGESIFAGAYTEPDAGTDVAGTNTRAERQGDEYVINGTKMFITNGSVCNYIVALCVTNPDAEKRTQKYSLILVDAEVPGVTRHKIHGKMGIRASDTAEIIFEDVHVPASNLIGEEGKGFYHLMHFFDQTRIMIAAQGVGLAQGALDMALKYVQERKTFGKPLAANQSIQFELAEMATRVELARDITYKAAWKTDHGQMDPSLNAMAKYYTGENAVWTVDKALQMHGGYGYIDEYDIQRFYRDAKILEIYEGTKEAEKMTIARRLF
ncbi:MAG: acyl-CoA dehydrogenase family protein [Candidatus Marinimicrobia bacterium]|nr:acyl-CoA dehydrogenase family protein [Candidatus Neomarinimicrobiota bacterium]